jgi:hypothetical protein
MMTNPGTARRGFFLLGLQSVLANHDHPYGNVAVASANSMRRMRHLLRSHMAIALLTGTGVLAAAVLSSSKSFAEQPLSAQNGEAVQSVEIGIDAYREGALEVSVKALSDALEGKLSEHQTAEAPYYRGLAHRELGKARP